MCIIMLDEKKTVNLTKKIVLRLLTGRLSGCEFTLVTGRTFFFVTDDKTIRHQHQGTLLPENIIYIPADQQGVNFEIIVKSQGETAVFLHEIQQGEVQERAIKPHQIITVGELQFAWRNELDDFDNNILLAKISGITAEQDQAIAIVKSSWWVRAVALGIVSCIALVCYGYLTTSQRQISSVSEILNYNSGSYQIVHGPDKVIYIVALNDKTADWATQTMIRNSLPYRIKIMTKGEEEKRISQWIEGHWPNVKLHRVKLDDSQYPVIELSAERSKLSEAEKSEFLASVKQSLPYANNVIITTLSDETVRTLAEQGLKKMALVFTESYHDDSATFVIRGAIEDGELERIKAFINQYYQTWGDNYVQFVLELKNDWLKGKSFKYGEQGYVKLSPGHWYFPSNLDKK